MTLAQLHQCLSFIVVQPTHCVFVIQKLTDQCYLPLLQNVEARKYLNKEKYC